MRQMTVLAFMFLMGCGSDGPAAPVEAAQTAQPIGVAECAACGMVVREQPAPRGQLIHRDGHRAHFCSIGDMVQYMRAPSPHGKVRAAFVELLDPAAPPRLTSSEPRPWTRAESAHYVVGTHREGIMGPPVLTYSTAESAGEVARRHAGRTQDWSALQGLSAAPHSGH